MRIADYDGTLRLVKMPLVHGLLANGSSIDSDIYALKLRQKSGIIIEKIHLEPEEDRADQDENL